MPASPTRSAATPPTGGSPLGRAPRSCDRTPVDGAPRCRRRIEVVAGGRHGPPRRPGRHRRRRLDQRPAGVARSAAAADRSPRSRSRTSPRRPRRASHRTGSRSGSGWTSRRFYGFPTYGEAGPKAAQDVGGRRSTPAAARSSPTMPPPRRLRDVHGRATCPGALGPAILHEDLPLHAHARTATSSSTACPTPRRRGRARRGHGFKFASVLGRIARRARARRRHAVGRRDRGVPDRPADPARGGPAASFLV